MMATSFLQDIDMLVDQGVQPLIIMEHPIIKKWGTPLIAFDDANKRALMKKGYKVSFIIKAHKAHAHGKD